MPFGVAPQVPFQRGQEHVIGPRAALAKKAIGFQAEPLFAGEPVDQDGGRKNVLHDGASTCVRLMEHDREHAAIVDHRHRIGGTEVDAKPGHPLTSC